MADVTDFLKNPRILTRALAQLCELEGQMAEAHVLKDATPKLDEIDYDFDGNSIFRLSLCVPIPFYAELGSGREKVEARILKKGKELFVPYPTDYLGSVLIVPQILTVEEGPQGEQFTISTEDLIREVEAQRDLMMTVATGGPKINTVNDEYRKRRQTIAEGLRERHIKDPNPHGDLWGWHGRWSSGDLPSWASRRTYITEMYALLLDRLASGPVSSRGVEVFDEPTGWARVDRSMGEARTILEEAKNEEQFQAVGLMCRETLFSLAGVVYDPAKHKAVDGKQLKGGDVKGQLEAYLCIELRGDPKEEMRQHAKAALGLAHELVHKRTADFRMAALCAEATASVVNLISIISGKRDPK